MARMARARRGSAILEMATRLRSNSNIDRLRGAIAAIIGTLFVADLLTYRAGDPSLDTAAGGPPANLLGPLGAQAADLALQSIGLTAGVIALMMTVAGLGRLAPWRGDKTPGKPGLRAALAVVGVIALAAAHNVPLANCDLALAALTWGTGMPPDTGRTLFAVARLAGWAAHYMEELTERPLRFRARAVYSV